MGRRAVGPFPVADLGHVFAVLPDIALVVDQFVANELPEIRGARAKRGHPVDDVIDHWNPAQGARIEGVKKFTPYKRAAEYAERLKLPKRDDQRSAESCEKMSVGLKAKYEENRV